MLNNVNYYWGSVRKLVVAFGVIFSDIHIVRTDKLGNAVKTIEVPCTFGPKEKWMVRNVQDPMPGKDDQLEMVLPRMTYDMLGVAYDSSRKLTSTGQTVQVLMSNNQVLQSQFNPVPYNFTFELYIRTKTKDDSLQIVEQILPFFTPDYSVKVIDMPQLNLEKEIPMILNSVTHEDSWEGDLQTTRVIVWTLNFTVKGYLYPPVNLQKTILDSSVNLYTPDDGLAETVESIASGTVTAVTISGATGYTIGDTPTVSFTASGSGAAGNVNVEGGMITSVLPTAPGSGYTSVPTVSITGLGVGAVIQALVGNGDQVIGYEVVNPGSGYTSNTTITITPTGAATATALATSPTDVVITVTDGGSGYLLVPPTVTLTGGTGTYTSAVATLSTSTYQASDSTIVTTIRPSVSISTIPSIAVLSPGQSKTFNILVQNQVYLPVGAYFTFSVPQTTQNLNDTWYVDPIHNTFTYTSGIGLRATQEILTVTFTAVADIKATGTIVLTLNPS